MKSYHLSVVLWLLGIATAALPPYWASVMCLAAGAFCMVQDVEDMPLWLRVPLWDVPVWLAYASVALLLQLVGLVLLLPMAAFRAWGGDFSRVYQHDGTPLAAADVGRTGRHVDRWRGSWLTWLWSNEEDGVTGPEWWKVRTGVASPFYTVAPWYVRAWSAYRWSALRNPSNNLRFVPGINPVIDPACIRHKDFLVFVPGQPWTFTWQGPFAGILVRFIVGGRAWRFWLGWKLKPEDANGVPDTDMRKPRCGFAMQFKRVGA